MQLNADYFIEKLNLTSHVEGGAFKETYRSDYLIPQNSLPSSFAGNRAACTAIYFLLKYKQFSAFHKIASDEIWHFYHGQTLTIYEIEANGHLITHQLGNDLGNGENFQCVVKAGNWFASRCEVSNGFSLVGCTVAPGFDFADFDLANQIELMEQFPHLNNLIKDLTY